MKRVKTIVVLNHTTKQVDLVPCPAEQEENSINFFLTGFGYDPKKCSYMLVDGDEVRVNNKGSNDYAILGDLTPYNQKQRIKQVEYETLIKRMQDLGVDSVEFEEEERPIIAAYLADNPGDFVVHEVQLYHSTITLIGHDKECWVDDIIEITSDDVFPGHLEYVTECIK